VAYGVQEGDTLVLVGLGSELAKLISERHDGVLKALLGKATKESKIWFFCLLVKHPSANMRTNVCSFLGQNFYDTLNEALESCLSAIQPLWSGRTG
jgi:hypothetical protein